MFFFLLLVVNKICNCIPSITCTDDWTFNLQWTIGLLKKSSFIHNRMTPLAKKRDATRRKINTIHTPFCNLFIFSINNFQSISDLSPKFYTYNVQQSLFYVNLSIALRHFFLCTILILVLITIFSSNLQMRLSSKCPHILLNNDKIRTVTYSWLTSMHESNIESRFLMPIWLYCRKAAEFWFHGFHLGWGYIIYSVLI